jgi:hypothetical protein
MFCLNGSCAYNFNKPRSFTVVLSADIIRVIKGRRVRWMVQTAHIGEFFFIGTTAPVGLGLPP